MSRLDDLVAKFESGLSVAGGSIDPNFDSSLASACYSEVVKSNAQALDLLGLGANSSEDILVSTRDAYLLLRMVGREHYHGLAITKHGALGYARSVMKKYEPQFLDAIRELGGVRGG
jgi:predicted regulator of Ras-like GTPase activity (Roadblock/LC7/MglB family)